MFNPISLLAAAALAAPVQMAQAQTTPQPAQQAPQQMSKADYAKTLDASFATVDTNKDGSLTAAEMAAAANAAQQQRLDAQFKKLDTNNDNQLSTAEFRAAAPPVKVDQAVSQLDSNKDGKISVQEWRTPRLASFDKADTNKDGVVTAAELQAAANKR